MTRKILPRELTAIISALASILGMALTPEMSQIIVDSLSAHAGQGVTAVGLMGVLGALVRIIYARIKEANNGSPDTDRPAAD